MLIYLYSAHCYVLNLTSIHGATTMCHIVGIQFTKRKTRFLTSKAESLLWKKEKEKEYFPGDVFDDRLGKEFCENNKGISQYLEKFREYTQER